MKISDINVEFAPSKIPFPNSLQIDYLKVRNVIIVSLSHDLKLCREEADLGGGVDE